MNNPVKTSVHKPVMHYPSAFTFGQIIVNFKVACSMDFEYCIELLYDKQSQLCVTKSELGAIHLLI